MHRSSLIVTLLLLSSFILTSCGSGRLTTRSASQKLKPVAPLPEREQSQLPVNLVITIDNVADAATSYRNFVELFINGKEIAPDQPENNLQSTYKYSLRLQPGIYEVKANYHAVGFWRERVFSISTDEPVKVLPGKRTELSIRLNKDHRGFLRRKKNLFAMRFAPLSGQEAAVASSAKIEKTESLRVVANKPPVILQQPEVETVDSDLPLAPAPRKPMRGTMKLQINTVPIGADVYVDDRFVGQSPVRVMINRSEGHIVQIARQGYKEYLKVLDAAELTSKSDVQIIIRLQKLE